MAYGLVQTVAPGTEPVTLNELKQWVRLDTDDTSQDQVLATLIPAARQHVEESTGRQMVTATWRWTMDDFPCDGVFVVPTPPLQSESSITYVDTNGTTQTISSSDYRVDSYSEPGRIEVAYGESWPTALGVSGAVTVTYVAGYGVAGSVPDGLKVAICLLAAHWYENREAVSMGVIPYNVSQALETLLMQYWTGTMV